MHERLGLDHDSFGAEKIDPLINNHAWERPLAYAHTLKQAAEDKGIKVTEDLLREVGANMTLYDGVEQLFDRVRQRAEEICPGVQVYFYLITAGFAEVTEGTSIAPEFTKIYGGAYAFDDDGCLLTAKRILTHHEKPRYLLSIAKGIDLDDPNPDDAFKPVDRDDWFVPTDQMMFVGDGSSDMPAFRFIEENGGIALGVNGPEGGSEWAHQAEAFGDRKVENYAPNSYAEDSELLKSILLGVDSIASLIKLREMGTDDFERRSSSK